MSHTSSLLLAAIACCCAGQAFAADPPAPPETTFTSYAEIGITAPTSSSSHVTYGHLFTDKPNQIVLNQLVATLGRDLDSKSDEVNWGFKLQGMFGSDARYTHFLGMFDRTTRSRYQFDLVEANVMLHLPWFDSGFDLKLGQYVTPLGAEVITAPANALYSHSYIFNFGIPLKHTGVLGVAHVSPVLDLYGGIDTGINTSLGGGDNNDSLAGIFGLGLNFNDGDLTLLALTHVGPENPNTKAPLGFPQADRKKRWIGDVVLTWKARSDLTLTTELNWIHDELFNATGYGVAQYASWTINDDWSVTLRGEVWRDKSGFFVAAFPGNRDFVLVERGDPTDDRVIATGRDTTYGALTVGARWTPAPSESQVKVALRPELRYDRTLNSVRPFDGRRDQFTAAIDLIISFAP